MGRRASELKKTVLQTGESEDDSQHEIHKSYGQLMKDSIELCSALAHKMERLRTKIHVASPRTVRRMQHPEVEASCAIPPTYSHEQPEGTRHQTVLEPRVPDKRPSQNSYVRRNQRSVANSKTSASKEPLSIESSNPVQFVPRRVNSQSQTVAAEATKVKARSEAQAKTVGSLPPLNFDDPLQLDQPRTLSDLPLSGTHEAV